MTITQTTDRIRSALPALIVLGRDGAGRAHASSFGSADAAPAARAASTMGMTALQVTAGELQRLAGELPSGRVFASGRAFVPFVGAKLYNQLEKHVATTSSQVGMTQVGVSNASGGKGEASTMVSIPAPTDWKSINVGQLVLASEGEDDGWWTSVVIKKGPDDVLELRWHGWPELETFSRRLEEVALFHPSHAAAIAKSTKKGDNDYATASKGNDFSKTANGASR